LLFHLKCIRRKFYMIIKLKVENQWTLT
jgi:hypothetical protein